MIHDFGYTGWLENKGYSAAYVAFVFSPHSLKYLLRWTTIPCSDNFSLNSNCPFRCCYPMEDLLAEEIKGRVSLSSSFLACAVFVKMELQKHISVSSSVDRV